MQNNSSKIKSSIKNIYYYINSQNVVNPSSPKNVKSILYICKGNICRSPFAEHISNRIIKNNTFKKVASSSAGLQVPNSLRSPQVVLETAEKFGVNLNAHKSKKITTGLAESNDMIIAMEAWQVKHLRKAFPMHVEKIFLLPLFEKNEKRSGWNYERFNISDPYGMPLPYFEECFHRIEKCVEELLTRLQ